jgi:hypothetical protein
MSSPCTIVSPSIADTGRGGLVVLVITPRKRSSVSAPSAPICSASRMETCLSKSNRHRITPHIQRIGVSPAAEVR